MKPLHEVIINKNDYIGISKNISEFKKELLFIVMTFNFLELHF